ncbi:histidine phosphatase family protein [Desulfobulbus propionicus]
MRSLIYLLRHGEIDSPRPRRFLGRSNPPLNANGIRQATRLGEALGAIPFCRVFSSPLDRAMQTATLVGGRSIKDIEPVDAFREINLGAWEGLTVAEVQSRFPGAYEERGLHLGAYRPEQGESFADVADRALPVLDAMAREFPGPILIVAHAGVNRALLSSLRHLPLDDLLQIPQDYCGVNILELQGNALTVQTINQTLL